MVEDVIPTMPHRLRTHTILRCLTGYIYICLCSPTPASKTGECARRSSFRKQVVPLYGALYEDKGFAKRTIFVVDKKGKVAYKREYEPGTQPDINEALDLLKKLK
jgi:hypothetical protein